MAEVEAPMEVAGDTPSESSEKKLSADAFQHFIQGKRHMLVQDYDNAVASLAEACELYVDHFGETAHECADVYFHYGKALFRHFQQQAGIIGNLVSEESEEEEEEKGSDSDEDKEKENTDDNENNEAESDGEDLGEEDDTSKGSSETSAKDSSKKADKPENSDQTNVDSTTQPSGEGSAATSGEAPTSEETPPTKDEAKPVQNLDEPGPSCPAGDSSKHEDISDLQLAWETLETARNIFQRQGSECEESQLKIAEILLILGEIGMELERFTEAAEDLNSCLEIRNRFLKPDDRLIAETHYQLGLAHMFGNEPDLALEHYQKSLDCINLRICNLKNQKEILKTPEGFDINPAEEIAELDGLLPDIKARMDDTKDMVQDAKNLVRKMVFQNAEEGCSAASSSSDKPITNINHLLKRKKPDEQESSSESDAKKMKVDTPPAGSEQVKPDSSTTEAASNS